MEPMPTYPDELQQNNMLLKKISSMAHGGARQETPVERQEPARDVAPAAPIYASQEPEPVQAAPQAPVAAPTQEMNLLDF